MKALVGAFNHEKALAGAFTMIVKNDCETDGSSAALIVISNPTLATINLLGEFSNGWGIPSWELSSQLPSQQNIYRWQSYCAH